MSNKILDTSGVTKIIKLIKTEISNSNIKIKELNTNFNEKHEKLNNEIITLKQQIDNIDNNINEIVIDKVENVINNNLEEIIAKNIINDNQSTEMATYSSKKIDETFLNKQEAISSNDIITLFNVK